MWDSNSSTKLWLIYIWFLKRVWKNKLSKRDRWWCRSNDGVPAHWEVWTPSQTQPLLSVVRQQLLTYPWSTNMIHLTDLSTHCPVLYVCVCECIHQYAENTCAHFPVGGIKCVSSRVAHLGGINTFLSPKFPLSSPETTHALKKRNINYYKHSSFFFLLKERKKFYKSTYMKNDSRKIQKTRLIWRLDVKFKCHHFRKAKLATMLVTKTT